MLRVGLSKVNITPESSLPMSGMLNPPKGQGVHFPLMARTMVFDDGREAAAIVCLDLLWLTPATMAAYRQAVTAGTHIPTENVTLTCNHTHRAPFTSSLMDEDTNWSYLDQLQDWLIQGMRGALAKLQPARLKVGRIQAPGWTHNRRPIYRTPLGEQVGTQGPLWGDDFVRLEGPEDHELQVLLAEDLDGRPLGGLVNFACHATAMGAQPAYSADFSGPLTDELSHRIGGVFGFVQGACGNLWVIDRSQDRVFTEMGPAHALRMADALADKAVEALAQGVYVEEPRVRTARQVLRIAQRRPTPEQVNLARWYLEKAPPDVDEDDLTRRIYGHAYTFFGNSADVQRWFCREVIGMWEWQRRVGTREIVEDVEVSAMAVGDVALVGFPAEYFTEFGLRLKSASPFRATLVAELANGWHGYVPTQEAFEHGGYEPRLAFSSRLAPEAGDRMCDAAIDLLRALHGEQPVAGKGAA
ncbi:MAG: hypothetical protein ACYC5M_00800 [Anaerolineae bacterium]